MKVSKETIVRTVVLIIALVNQILVNAGANPLPFAEDDIYVSLTNIFTLGSALWAWWKNNSFTKSAISADKYMRELKKEDGYNEH